MRINNNIAALNALNQTNVNSNHAVRNVERVSSGIRINRATDDAAGLSISEKMRGQIRGLENASTNAQEGISLIQTAEGALNEIHAILQRQRELAVQGATGISTNEDLAAIQRELYELSAEVSLILGSTAFNNKNLLDGTAENEGTIIFQIGANPGQQIKLHIENMSDVAVTINDIDTDLTDLNEVLGEEVMTEIEERVWEEHLTDIRERQIATLTAQLKEKLLANMDPNSSLESALPELIELGIDAGINRALNAALEGKAIQASDIAETIMNTVILRPHGGDVVEAMKGDTINSIATSILNGLNENSIVVIENKVVNEQMATAKATFIIDQEGYAGLISDFDEAIKSVSQQRSQMGTVQNRLEYITKNIHTSVGNLISAESRIRDADIASEMLEMTKNNVLHRASQAILAQANQQPQSILRLLR